MRRANNSFGVQGYAPVQRRGRSNAMGTSSGYAPSPLYTEQDEDDLESQPGDTPYQAAATEAYNAGSPGAVGTVTEEYNADSPGAVGEVTEPYRMPGGQPVADQPEETTDLLYRPRGEMRLPDGTIIGDEEPMHTTLPYRPRGEMRLPDGTIIGDEEKGPGHFEQYEAGAANNSLEAGAEHALYSITDNLDEPVAGQGNESAGAGNALYSMTDDLGEPVAGQGNTPDNFGGDFNRIEGNPNESLPTDDIGEPVAGQGNDPARNPPIHNDVPATNDATAAYEADPPPVQADDTNLLSPEDIAANRTSGRSLDSLGPRGIGPRTVNEIPRGNQTIFNQSDDEYAVQSIREQGDQDAGAIDALIGDIEGISSRHNENAPPIKRDKQVRDPDSFLDGPGNTTGHQDALDGGDATANTVERGNEINAARDPRNKDLGRRMAILGENAKAPETGPGQKVINVGEWGEIDYKVIGPVANARKPEKIREDVRKETQDRLQGREKLVDKDGNVTDITKNKNNEYIIPVGAERIVIPEGLTKAEGEEYARDKLARRKGRRIERGEEAQAKKDRIAKFREDKKNAGPTGQQFRNAYNAITRRSNAGLITPEQANTELNYLAQLQGFGRGGAAAGGAPGAGAPAAGTPGAGTPAAGTPATARTQSITPDGRFAVDQNGNATPDAITRTQNWINDPTVQSRWQGVYGGAEGAMDSFNNPNSGVSDLIGSGEGRTSIANHIAAQPPGQQNQLYEDMFDRLQAAYYSKSNDAGFTGWSDSDRANDLQALHHEDLMNDIQSVFNGKKHSSQQKRDAVRKWLAYGNQVQSHSDRNAALDGRGAGALGG